MSISASVRSHGVRTGTAAAAALAVAGFTLAGAPAAFAAPGDSGDLTVQSVGAGRGGQHRDGAPKVCEFRVTASNFETLPAIPFTIIAQPPTVPPGNTLAGTLALSQGVGSTQDYQLPDGTYQLLWTVPAGIKQKSFVVDCGQEQGSRGGGGKDDSSWSASDKESKEGQEDKEYTRPSGGVPAGGGGVPTMDTVNAQGDSSMGTTAALTAGAAGVAGLILVRRAARRRARGEA